MIVQWLKWCCCNHSWTLCMKRWSTTSNTVIFAWRRHKFTTFSRQSCNAHFLLSMRSSFRNLSSFPGSLPIPKHSKHRSRAAFPVSSRCIPRVLSYYLSSASRSMTSPEKRSYWCRTSLFLMALKYNCIAFNWYRVDLFEIELLQLFDEFLLLFTIEPSQTFHDVELVEAQ